MKTHRTCITQYANVKYNVDVATRPRQMLALNILNSPCFCVESEKRNEVQPALERGRRLQLLLLCMAWSGCEWSGEILIYASSMM